jgi:transposase-like protein
MRDTTPDLDNCPDCGADDVIVLNQQFALFRCEACGATFSDDDTPSRTTVHRRTRPRPEFDGN